MKRLALLLLIVVTTTAQAMWVTVTRNEVATVYIDSMSIEKMGYNRRVWVVYDLTAPDKTGQQSVKSHIDYDCTEGKYKTLSASSHPNKMGNGPPSKPYPSPMAGSPSAKTA